MSEPTDRDLQEYAERLARFRALSAPSAMRRDLRGALLAAPVTATAPAGTAWAMRTSPRTSWIGWLRPLLAVIVVFAILAGGAGAAAAGSLPGDAAFGLKRAVEDVQVAIAPDDTARLNLLTAQTERRLDELESLASRGASAVGVATDEYVAALARLEGMLAIVSSEPATSVRDAAIERAQTAAAAHVARLETLAGTLPDSAQQGIQRAIDTGRGIGTHATPEPSRPSEPGKPSDLPTAPGGGRSNAPSSRPTAPTPTRR